MIKRLINIILILGYILLSACVDEYWPELNDYDNLLVVDGIMTNNDDTTTVNLSRSSSLDYGIYNPVQYATVSIISDDGSEAFLWEREPGEYLLTDPDFERKAGNSYNLTITLNDGSNYESGFRIMKSPDPIDSIYSEIEYQLSSNPNYQPQGLRFYIDNHGSQMDTSSYLWRIWQTYKYKSSFTLDYLWEGYFVEMNDPDSLMYCYRTKKVKEIFTYSTKYLDENKLVKYPLVFTSTETKTLSIRCRVLVEQIVISDADFIFWEALRKQEENQGNLYSHNPIQIRGNIRNVDDDSEVVLGNFTVGGSAFKTYWVNRPAKLNFYYTICAPDFDAMMFITDFGPDTWPVFVTEIPGSGKALGASDFCFDCRLEGGSLTPPEFWTDN